MTQTRLNPKQIKAIEVNRKLKATFIKYDNGFSLFGITFRKEGFYSEIRGFLSREDLQKENFTINSAKEVFYKPHIVIEMVDGDFVEMFFDSNQDLDFYLSKEEFKDLTLLINT